MASGYRKKGTFILRNQQLFWDTAASWEEMTGSINFVPVLVSQQSHINEDKNYFFGL
jgi:hypothetical protein